MLQFKFRGRRPNGEWVYGAYIPPEYTLLGYASIVTKEHRFDVDPESVGILVGRTADGEEIYSGSRLECSWKDERVLGTVGFAGAEVRVGGKRALGAVYIADTVIRTDGMGGPYVRLIDLLLYDSNFSQVKFVEEEGKGAG